LRDKADKLNQEKLGTAESQEISSPEPSVECLGEGVSELDSGVLKAVEARGWLPGR
jgi:hypothetical protein